MNPPPVLVCWNTDSRPIKLQRWAVAPLKCICKHTHLFLRLFGKTSAENNCGWHWCGMRPNSWNVTSQTQKWMDVFGGHWLREKGFGHRSLHFVYVGIQQQFRSQKECAICMTVCMSLPKKIYARNKHMRFTWERRGGAVLSKGG